MMLTKNKIKFEDLDLFGNDKIKIRIKVIITIEKLKSSTKILNGHLVQQIS